MAGNLYGAIEAGGTKFNCAVLTEDRRVVTELRVPTTQPQPTLQAVADFFTSSVAKYGELSGLGMAAFGPLDLNPGSSTFGALYPTPKPGWSGASLLASLRTQLNCPVAIDTDVNAAALAESEWGAGRGCRSLVYVTVGTGIGGGAVVDGTTLRGRMHPEMGHIQVRRHPRDLAFAGICPFHGDCLEGLASGPAIKARWGQSLDQLEPEHEAFEIIGYYLGQMAATTALMLSVERIVIGGGVMQCTALLPRIRDAAHAALNGYLPQAAYPGGMADCIQTPLLANNAGVLGAFLLARRAAA